MNNFGSLGLLRGPWSATRVVRRPLPVVRHYGGPRDMGGGWCLVWGLLSLCLRSSIFRLWSCVFSLVQDIPSGRAKHCFLFRGARTGLTVIVRDGKRFATGKTHHDGKNVLRRRTLRDGK